MKVTTAASAALVLWGAVPAQAGQFIYTSLDISGFSTQISGLPHALNDRDEVVGSVGASLPLPEGFLWKDGAFTRYAAPSALGLINDSGRAAGFGRLTSGYLVLNTMTGESRLFADGFAGTLMDINASGQIAAQSEHDHIGIGYVLNKGAKTRIMVPGSAVKGGGTYPTALNAAGTVTGYYRSGSTTAAFMYAKGIYTIFSAPESWNTTPVFIDSDGTIGGSFTSAQTYALAGFVYRGGRFTLYLPPNALSAVVTGIGPGGEVVGSYEDAHIRQHGFITRGGTYHTIDFPTPASTEADTAVDGVNALGSLIGTYTDSNQVTHPFIARCALTAGCSQ